MATKRRPSQSTVHRIWQSNDGEQYQIWCKSGANTSNSRLSSLGPTILSRDKIINVLPDSDMFTQHVCVSCSGTVALKHKQEIAYAPVHEDIPVTKIGPCPKCHGRLMYDELDIEFTCVNCGHTEHPFKRYEYLTGKRALLQ